MKRTIQKAAVLGSGVMGSRIACHFANAGLEVVLLDIPPRELNAGEQAKGLALDHPKVRNRIVNDSLKAAVKSNPSPLFRKSLADRITTGNFDDNLDLLADCDWIIEAVVENLGIKQQLFEKVEQHRKPGSLISSNTSGIPINMMLDGRSEDFRKNFCGTHFFNPPRYLKLLEVIPTPDTDPEVVDFHMEFGHQYLGKTTVLCKDTPAFIANRVGVYAIMALFHQVKEMGLTVDEVDKLTGPVLGRPKSATFRTCDVVGLDTLVKVAGGLDANLPDDEARHLFKVPDYIGRMVENNWLGSKSGQGFYKKVKDEKGKSQILSLNLDTLEYGPKAKVKFPTLDAAKPVEDLRERMKVLFSGKDRAGEFYRRLFAGLFQYVSNRLPEISDDLYKIDDALRAGFGWELGPFETMDAIGVDKAIELMEAHDKKPAAWMYDMKEAGVNSFYAVAESKRQYYDVDDKAYRTIPGQDGLLSLSNLRAENTVWKNSGATITDLGDGILNLEFHTKMNVIGSEIMQGINKAIDLAEKDYRGLVIYNEGQNFSAGANVGLMFMMAVEQEYDELDFAVRAYQNTVMRLRYSDIPVVAAPHNMALGGSCELCMHADKVVAHAELYMGLVEFGVGLIPGGAGTKEFALRASDEFNDGGIRINVLRQRFLTVGQAKVSTSASEAFDLGYLIPGRDEMIISRDHQLAYAKEAAIAMADKGYQRPVERKDITVLGQEGLGIVYAGANTMLAGNYISEHDQLISQKLGEVLCGGDLSSPTKVSESYLLKLERRAFVELCAEKKTMERMQSLLTTGKILRN